jgi:NADPH:quinone reductase-like Zn-dependent oxidoreductase
MLTDEATTMMTAMAQDRYGSPEVLRAVELPRPVPAEGRVLVRVQAASVNPADWHIMTGRPLLARMSEGWRRPKQRVRGIDVAGVVEAVGPGVTRFAVGDAVFGGAAGSLAQWAVAREKSLALLPSGVTVEQAAAVPVAGVTALQALRDKAHVHAGQHVLVNGAAGGVGTYAVQIAKALGARVTAVCSTRNVELVRSLGPDDVIDYTVDDFATRGRRYDVIVDNVGTRPARVCRRALNRGGVYVMVSGPKKGVLGPIRHMLWVKLVFVLGRRRMKPILTQLGHEGDLDTLAGWLADGTIRSVVTRTEPLEAAPELLREIGGGHARGKLVVRVGS